VTLWWLVVEMEIRFRELGLMFSNIIVLRVKGHGCKRSTVTGWESIPGQGGKSLVAAS